MRKNWEKGRAVRARSDMGPCDCRKCGKRIAAGETGYKDGFGDVGPLCSACWESLKAEAKARLEASRAAARPVRKAAPVETRACVECRGEVPERECRSGVCLACWRRRFAG